MNIDQAKLAESLMQATLEAVTSYGSHGFARSASLAEVSRLLSAGADPSLTCACAISGSQTSALVLAAAKGDVECLKILAAGPHGNLDRQDTNGYTALLAAAQFAGPEAVMVLLNAGANPNATGIHGWNALMHATWTNDYHSCAALAPLTNLDHLAENENDVHKLAALEHGDFREPIRLLLASEAEARALAKDCPAARSEGGRPRQAL